jgi:hypothetical protein
MLEHYCSVLEHVPILEHVLERVFITRVSKMLGHLFSTGACTNAAACANAGACIQCWNMYSVLEHVFSAGACTNTGAFTNARACSGACIHCWKI